MDTSEAPALQPLPFRRPADYYSSPVEDVKPIFPRWVPIGCGSASIVILILMLLGAAAASSGAFTELFELMFASMHGEVDKMMAPDVKPAQKAAFDAEMKTMREGMRTGKVKMEQVQPLLRSLRDVVTDEKVTSSEVETLTREIRAINSKR